MAASDICAACMLRTAHGARVCSCCGSDLHLPARGALSLWRLGQVGREVLDPFTQELSRVLRLPVLVQPSFIDPRAVARRDGWRGVSATAFLNQVDQRHAPGCVLSLGMTELNIVPGRDWNFVFGLGYMPGNAAVVSLAALRTRGASKDRVVERAVKIALHELGHCCGLDHHDYASGVDCLMLGDVEQDSVRMVDDGSRRFCEECRVRLRKRLRGMR